MSMKGTRNGLERFNRRYSQQQKDQDELFGKQEQYTPDQKAKNIFADKDVPTEEVFAVMTHQGAETWMNLVRNSIRDEVREVVREEMQSAVRGAIRGMTEGIEGMIQEEVHRELKESSSMEYVREEVRYNQESSSTEAKSTTVRQRKPIVCSVCGEQGHNKRTCLNQ